jgi:hypothetical protein
MFKVKKKWTAMKSTTKAKASTLYRERRATGGGSCSVPDLTPAEEQIVGVVGADSIQGISGGIDTSDLDFSGMIHA